SSRSKDRRDRGPRIVSMTTPAIRSRESTSVDDVIDLLKAHEYFRGVSDAILGEIAQFAKITHYDAAEIVHQFNDPLASICFILRGRLKAVRVDSRDVEHLFQMFERGEQYGMMLGGLGEPVPVRIFALEPSTILSLDHEKAMELTLLYPDLRRQWLQSYARSLRRRFLEPAAVQAPNAAGNSSRIPGDAVPRANDHRPPARIGRSGVRSQ
ncbi:MAG TPA: Crp/Fnr family transcriptional regulator, partial [Pseudolabrys sp.]